MYGYMVAYITQPTLPVLPYKCTVYNMPYNIAKSLPCVRN